MTLGVFCRFSTIQVIVAQIIYPKCGYTDKVYEVEYGAITVEGRINKKGETTDIPIYKGKYQAETCVVKIAKYYCDRDKIKF
jgi:hypothetical protein